jgi:O-antigen/teichoic acid export membrane protein
MLLQLVANQLFGLVIFYILSTSLSKDNFGLLNLALAILLGVFNILSCGMDQLVVKKIAADDDNRIRTVALRHPYFNKRVVILWTAFSRLLVVSKAATSM